MENIKFSIITVAFNSEETLADTIESVLNQTYDNVEYIVIDGLSNDNTVKIAKSFKARMTNKMYDYQIVSEKDNGIFDAINKGIKLATGDIIGILNSDDYYFDQNVLSILADAFLNNNVDCVYGNLIFIDPKTMKVTRKWISENFQNGLFEKSWTPAHPTFYCKRELYLKYGNYRTDFCIAADVELMFRFLEKHRIRYHYINRTMVIMRQGGISNNGIKSTIIITKEMIRAFKDNGVKLNIFKYLLFKSLKIKERIFK